MSGIFGSDTPDPPPPPTPPPAPPSQDEAVSARRSRDEMRRRRGRGATILSEGEGGMGELASANQPQTGTRQLLGS